MSSIRTILLALIALSMFAVSCSDDDPNGPQPGQTSIRLLHNVYDGDALDLRVNGTVVASNVTYKTSSGYKAVAPSTPGQADVSVHYAGDPNPRNSSKQTLGEGLAYTVYAFPPAAAFAAGFQNDPRETSADKSRIKLVNATFGPDSIKLELWITGAKTKLIGPLTRTQVAQYIDVLAGSYSFTLRQPNDTSWSMEFNPVTLNSQGAYTIVMHGTLREDDAYPFAVRMYTDNGTGDQAIDWTRATSTGKVIFANAIVGSGPTDVAVDGSVSQITGLNFGAASNYRTFNSGDHTYSAGSGGTALLSNVPFNITARTNHTMFMIGTRNPIATESLFLEDITTPNLSQAMVRFVHLSPDAPAVKIGVKELAGYIIPMASNLSYKQVSQSASTSSPFLMLPPGTYTLQYINAQSDSVLKEVPNMIFAAGLIYTNWLGGSATANSLNAYNILHN